MAQQAAKRALNVVVLLGSVRENNMGLRAANFMVSQLVNNGHQVKLLGKLGRGRAWRAHGIRYKREVLYCACLVHAFNIEHTYLRVRVLASCLTHDQSTMHSHFKVLVLGQNYCGSVIDVITAPRETERNF